MYQCVISSNSATEMPCRHRNVQVKIIATPGFWRLNMGKSPFVYSKIIFLMGITAGFWSLRYTIQWLGGSDLELWVFIFPIKWRAKELSRVSQPHTSYIYIYTWHEITRWTKRAPALRLAGVVSCPGAPLLAGVGSAGERGKHDENQGKVPWRIFLPLKQTYTEFI